MQHAEWMAVARQQFGLVTRGQLVAARVPPAGISRLVSRGVLERVATGIFRVAGHAWDPMQVLWSAALGTRGVLTGGAALFALGHVDRIPQPLTVYCRLAASHARMPGVRVVRRTLPDKQVSEVAGLAVVARWLAVIDHCAGLPFEDAVVFADRALQQHWVSRQQIDRHLESPRRGNQVVRRVFAGAGDGCESQAERAFVALLRREGLQGWVTGFRVPGLSGFGPVDVAFPHRRVAVEVDGLAYHGSRGRFQADRSKQNALVALGWTVLRFTWWDITQSPEEVVARVRHEVVNLTHM